MSSSILNSFFLIVNAPWPLFNNGQFQLFYCCKLTTKGDFLLEDTPNSVIYTCTGFRSGLFWGHTSGSMKVTFLRWRKFIVFLAVCDGAPSCCSVHLWRLHLAWISGNNPCLIGPDDSNIHCSLSLQVQQILVYTDFSHPRQTNRNHDATPEMSTFAYESCC